MSDFITQTIERMGYLGVALLTFLENLFPPLPSEVILPGAGFAASQGDLSPVLVTVAGSVGSLAGTTLFYVLGRKLGEDRARRWIVEHGRWLTLEEEDLDRAKRWFAERGKAAVLVGRCVPGVRTLISLPAGFAGMPLGTFLAFSAVGTLIWTAALTYAGVLLGEQFSKASDTVGWASTAIVATLLVGFGVWIYRRRSRMDTASKSA